MISDEALMAFVSWCRMNDWRFVGDPVLVRRVFDAYALIPNIKDISTTELRSELVDVGQAGWNAVYDNKTHIDVPLPAYDDDSREREFGGRQG